MFKRKSSKRGVSERKSAKVKSMSRAPSPPSAPSPNSVATTSPPQSGSSSAMITDVECRMLPPLLLRVST